jgi:cytosol alanyl aminopeptidase
MPMARVPKSVVRVATALVFSASALAAQPAAPDFRLPDAAHPTRYHVDLTILPSEPTFRGSEVIGVALTKRTNVVWLNAKDIQIQQVSVKTAEGSRVVRWHASGEFLAVELAKPAAPGPLEIAIQYTGTLDDTATVGAYRQKSGPDWYVYTSFTPIDARRAFPCFDEPGYKAPWELVLHVKRDEVAVANAPAVSTEDEPDGMKRVAFAPTQPLASEVIAFAVGPFDVVDAGVAGEKRTPVRIITPRGRGAEAAAARTATPEILARLEQYTGIPYPWDKLDHIALLDMPFGATENPGLITYRADLLLAAPNEDTQQRQQLMRSVMAHEMAHQWFGNLVTQAWWNDTWLSEGFATWLEAKISDMERPRFERGLTITETRNVRMAADSAGTRPVRLEMHSRRETDDVYDDVIYSKGGSILEMLEDWLGPAAFQRSLHRYLTDHQFGNATSSDLIAAIKAETGVDVGPVLVGFLDRPGAPVLRFSVAPGDGAAKLVVDQGANPWTIPVCFHAASMDRRCEVVSTSHAELQLPGPVAWVWPNAYGSGYYRSVLTEALLDTLVANGYGQLESPERLALAGDLESLTNTGQMPAAEAMTILPRMMRDPEARVRSHLDVLILALAEVAPESARGTYAEWLWKTMGLRLPVPEQATSVEGFLRNP